MPQSFHADPVVRRRNAARGTPWRLVVQLELAVLLVLAVALTVAPQVVLDAVAVAATKARDFSLSYRSAVALVGLLFVAAAAVGLWVLSRPRRGEVRAAEAMPSEVPPGTVGEADDTDEGGKRRVA